MSPYVYHVSMSTVVGWIYFDPEVRNPVIVERCVSRDPRSETGPCKAIEGGILPTYPQTDGLLVLEEA